LHKTQGGLAQPVTAGVYMALGGIPEWGKPNGSKAEYEALYFPAADSLLARADEVIE
jgi:hypothetical protein